MPYKENNNRRGFLKRFLSVGPVIGFISRTTAQSATAEKVKMLTPDGKLVEIDKSILAKKSNVKRASDKEVLDWMNARHKK
jgi:hypothetical protein